MGLKPDLTYLSAGMYVCMYECMICLYVLYILYEFKYCRYIQYIGIEYKYLICMYVCMYV